MLGNGEKLISYRFEGYWKDVGTIESLWEANMDLLSPKSGLNLSDDTWRIYGRNNGAPPHFTSKEAKVTHSQISEGCEIRGNVSESILFSDVVVGKGATVRYAIVAEGAHICSGAVVGDAPSEVEADAWGVAVVASGVRVGKGAKLAAKGMAGEDLPDAE